MNLTTRLYLQKFSNRTGYCTGMRDYLTDEVKKGNLNRKQLKYLYKNLYKKSNYIQQNIFPVSQAMIKGASTTAIERISNKLVDANKFTIFSVGYHNDKYNKLFHDLEFVLNKYCDMKDRCMQSTIHKKMFLYIRSLNYARSVLNLTEDKLYDYVENDVRNYRRNYNKFRKAYTPDKSFQIIGHRHSIANTYYPEKQNDNEKELDL